MSTIQPATQVTTERKDGPPVGRGTEPESQKERATFTLHSDFITRTSFDAWLHVQNALLHTRQAAFHVNHLHAKKAFEKFVLSKGAQSVLTNPNAGGASEKSECLSYELLSRVWGLRLLKTEMEIDYRWSTWSKKTDYSVQLRSSSSAQTPSPAFVKFKPTLETIQSKLGVSVTRAMKYKGTFSIEDGVHLLKKKLYGVICSSKDVSALDRWAQQLLHIFTSEAYIVDVLHQAYQSLDKELLSNTVVLVTLTTDCPWIYSNRS